jgi:hypothetical protein
VPALDSHGVSCACGWIEDAEAAELRALADMRRSVRFSELACELEERQRAAMGRQLEAWEEYEAAVEAKLSIQAKLTMYALLALNGVACVAVAVIELVRLL